MISEEKNYNLMYNGVIILGRKYTRNLYEVQFINENKNARYKNVIYKCNNENCIEFCTGNWNRNYKSTKKSI